MKKSYLALFTIAALLIGVSSVSARENIRDTISNPVLQQAIKDSSMTYRAGQTTTPSVQTQQGGNRENIRDTISNPVLQQAVQDSTMTYRVDQNQLSDTQKTFDAECISSALVQRENSIMSAYNVFSSKVSAALATRQQEYLLAVAMGSAKERKQAVTTLKKKFNTEVKTAYSEFKSSRTSIYKESATSISSCQGGRQFDSANPMSKNPFDAMFAL